MAPLCLLKHAAGASGILDQKPLTRRESVAPDGVVLGLHGYGEGELHLVFSNAVVLLHDALQHSFKDTLMSFCPPDWLRHWRVVREQRHLGYEDLGLT